MMKILKHILFIFILLGTAFLIGFYEKESQAAEWQAQTMIKPGEGATPLLPFLDYYIDISRDMDIEEVSAQNLSTEFKPLVLNQLPRMEGVCWLRFTIAPIPPETRPATFLLDMGQSFPGLPFLFVPERNELSGALEWREKSPSQRNIMLLPEEGSQAITCYVKIDGLPGPWFAPMIRTPQDAASNLSSLARNAAILALAVVMVICLLRGLGEQGQWRIWTALFVAVALCQAILGMPAIRDKFSIASLAAVLAPGIALMLLPHVGRHLLQTPVRSKSLDIQLFLLSFPGAALALLPLIPGWSWLDRWVDAWPLCTLIFVPTAIAAWIMGLGGGRRFLLACIIPPIFTAFGLAGLDFGFLPNILSSMPIWGIALCALLIASTRSPILTQKNSKKTANKNNKTQDVTTTPDGIISLDHPLDDPNLRLLPTREELTPTQPNESQLPTVEYAPANSENVKNLEEREDALRTPLDDILREAAALGQCSLPPAVRQYAENIVSSANLMADVISGEKILPQSAVSQKAQRQNISFSLQSVLRNVHDSVASFAESAGTALSWYIPPNLGRFYLGNEQELINVLHLLLESSVRASKNGSVHLSARRVPGSDDPGHILFSITDNGSGVPPKDRSSLAISRAWELIGRHGGYLSMEAGPNGVDIALSMRFPVEGEEEQGVPAENHVILASDNIARRRELAEAIAQLPCRISQLGTSQEVLVCQSSDPAALLIAHGQMARPSAADTIHKFVNMAREAGFAKSFILAITEDDKQWHLLKHSGFTHAMQEPEDLETLRDTISALLQALRENQIISDEQGEEQIQVQTNEDDSGSGKVMSNSAFFTYDSSRRDDNNKSASKNSNSPSFTNTPLGTDSASLAKEAELPAFEGPDWLNPSDDEKTTSDKENSGLFFPQASEMKLTPNEGKVKESDYESNNELQVEDPEQSSTPIKIVPEIENSQVPYNSIMEYVIGAENKDELASSESKSRFDTEEGANSLNLSSQTNSDKLTNRAPAEGKSDENGDPVVQALIMELDNAMAEASNAYEAHDSMAVAEATGRIIRESENVGLRLLARMASCVERAARENDLNALSDLLPELALAVERNRLALNQNRRDNR